MGNVAAMLALPTTVAITTTTSEGRSFEEEEGLSSTVYLAPQTDHQSISLYNTTGKKECDCAARFVLRVKL